MPTNMTSYYPFASGAGANVSESQWRNFMGRVVSTAVLAGVYNELNTFGDSTGLQVKVDTGACWVRGHYGEIPGAVTILALASVSGIPGGQSRIDRVVARADFTAKVVQLDVLTGTAGATPSPPALTQSTSLWEIALADIGDTANGASAAITNATTTIAAGMVVDARWKATPSGIIYRDQYVTSGTVPSFVIPNIIGGYRDLDASWGAVTDQGSGQALNMTVNGDGGSNYSWAAKLVLLGGGADVNSSVNSGFAVRIGTAGTVQAAGRMTIQNYALALTASYRLYESRWFQDSDTTGAAGLAAGEWKNSANALTKLVMSPAAGNLKAGSWYRVELRP